MGFFKCEVRSKLNAAILTVFNSIFFLVGVVVLTFGSITLADPQLVINFFNRIPGFKEIQYIIDIQEVILGSAIALITIGCVVVVVSFFGCCGASARHGWMLHVYWISSLVLLLCELALVIWVAVDTANIKSHMGDIMFTQLEKYFEPVKVVNNAIIYPTDPANASWPVFQFQYSCCGARGYEDYRRFAWDNTIQHNADTITNATVPLSCCTQYNQYIVANFSNFVDHRSCLELAVGETTARNIRGCDMAVSEIWSEHSYIMTITVAGLITLEVFAVVLALLLMKQMKKSSKTHPDSDRYSQSS